MNKPTSTRTAMYSILRRVRTEEAKRIRRLTGTNPFQAKRIEVAPYDYAPTVTCSPCIDNLILVEYD